MKYKRIHLSLLAPLLLLFGVVEANETVRVKVIENEGDLVLILPSPYTIQGAPVSPCKIDGRHEPCYVLRREENILIMPSSLPPQRIDKAEREQAITAARQAGLSGPFKVERIPANDLLSNFDVSALTAGERAELKKQDVRSPLCERVDGSSQVPCPVRQGTQFGRLLAKEGGCLWSPSYGIPATTRQTYGSFVDVSAIQCSADAKEWGRIQRSALPR